jgi:hypothetical protein
MEVVYGNCSFATKLRRRISALSIPSFWASTSIIRSIR